MSILNKYKRWVPMLVHFKDEYWDFVLSQDGTPSLPFGSRMTDRCLASYIEFGMKECQEKNGVCSLPGYRWEDCNSEKTILEDIGYTGVDNGLIYYGGWDKVTNKEFYEIFTNSKYEIGGDDCRLHLHQVTGNTGVYSYPMEYVENGYYTLKGGFFQGFYKLFGFDYQILPQYIEDEWNVEFVLRPKYEILDEKTLNATHPGNEGIFFYMGTRAENKFLQIYNTDLEKYPEREQPERKFCDDDYFIIVEEPEKKMKKISEKTDKEFNKRKARWFAYFLNVYGFNEYSVCGCGKGRKCPDKKDEDEEESCLNYLADLDYMERDVIISGATLVTTDGVPVEDSGYYEIETDNKFLTFNRTKYGFTTANWDEDTMVVLTGSTNDIHSDNLYLLMHRGCSGYTTETIDQYYSENKKEYDFISDTLGNAFALKRNDDGSITYRYMVLDCDKEEKYSIFEETSFPGLLPDNKWATVNVKFSILNGGLDECKRPLGERKMRIFIYVNGYLKLVSKELPEFNFRELKEHYEKQEGVPFNISVGGGTQGLCDSVWLDYSKAFEKILPIEQNFAGTFIGDIKSFRFYTCKLSLSEIRNNHLFNRSNWR